MKVFHTYLLRHVPSDLWLSVLEKAEREHRSVRIVIVTLLRQYVGQEIYTGPVDCDNHLRSISYSSMSQSEP